ncbi:hypothetical protein BD410DRAFT_86873 [Rickenella mellea]|uniref:Uncharacterized protein n=1 Tax=Rickenella mellea TaxID=50990 RepID=A0A4Y7PMN6_9AGAM|nr:hypothetical protein BD410DRAFT_86873 [Rickenella mellea]
MVWFSFRLYRVVCIGIWTADQMVRFGQCASVLFCHFVCSLSRGVMDWVMMVVRAWRSYTSRQLCWSMGTRAPR